MGNKNQSKPYRPVVIKILNKVKPKTILDVPSGSGWLNSLLSYKPEIDGIDLFEKKPQGYRSFQNSDLDCGLPSDLPRYDCIVSCEGIEHIGNPNLFLKTAREHLTENGLIVITTPNIWYPEAKLQFLWRGFFPSFPCLIGKIQHGSHKHIMSYSFPQLYLYLKLCEFHKIQLHSIDTKKPKRTYEKVIGLPQYMYCSSKQKKATSEEEELFWRSAGSKQSIYGRHLIVSAKVNCN